MSLNGVESITNGANLLLQDFAMLAQSLKRNCNINIRILIFTYSFIFGGYDGDSRLNDFHYFLIDERTCEIPPGTLISDLEGLVG